MNTYKDQEKERQLNNHHVESETKRAAAAFWKKRSADGVRDDSRVCDRLSAGQAEGLP